MLDPSVHVDDEPWTLLLLGRVNVERERARREVPCRFRQYAPSAALLGGNRIDERDEERIRVVATSVVGGIGEAVALDATRAINGLGFDRREERGEIVAELHGAGKVEARQEATRA